MNKRIAGIIVVALLAAVGSAARSPAEVWTKASGSTPPWGVHSSNAVGMAAYKGRLYVQFYNSTSHQLWAYDGTNWTDTAAIADSPGTSINSLVVYKNLLYVEGMGTYDGATWTALTLSGPMIVYSGLLYLASGSVFDGTTWTTFTPPYSGAYSLAVSNSALYVGTANYATGGKVWSFNGSTWTDVSPVPSWSSNNQQVDSLAWYNGHLYAGTFNMSSGGQVFRYDGGTTWTNVGPNWGIGNVDAWSMTVYNGLLYVGTDNFLGAAQVWRYDGSTWTNVSPGWTSDLALAGSMAVYSSALYVGCDALHGAAEIWATQPILLIDGFETGAVARWSASEP